MSVPTDATGTTRLLRQQPFLLLLLARAVSALGMSFGPLAVTFGVLGLPGTSESTLSVVLAAQSVPMVLMVLVGGVLADRFSRRNMMVLADLMAGGAFTALATMFLTGLAPTAGLVSAMALAGTALALFYPALIGMVPEVVAAADLQKANATLRLATNTMSILGLALAGAAVAFLGPGWALIASAAGFFGSAASLSRLRPAAARPHSGGRSVINDLREGWDEFASRQWLVVIVAQFALLIGATQAGFGVLGPLVAEQHYGGARAWSTVLAAQSAGMLVGVGLSARIRPRRPIRLATLACLPVALPLLTLGMSAPLVVVAAAGFLFGVALDVFSVLWSTTMQREVPGEALSRVSAYDGLGSLVLGPVGLLLAAPLAGAIGPQTALLGCAAVIVISTGLALLSPQVRNLPAPPTAPGVPDPQGGVRPPGRYAIVPNATPDSDPAGCNPGADHSVSGLKGV
ncbi:MAG TPA: MFS transporter [Actinomycetales bacterium]|nr:MFS transporter [Actinomycetales bacterium]